MSEPVPTTLIDRDAQSRKAKRIFRFFMWGCLLISAGAVGWAYALYRPALEGVRITDQEAVRSSGVIDQPARHLAPGFADAKGRLLADPPASADQLIDPATIVIGRWESGGDSTPDVSWEPFTKHLKEATGRDVKIVKYTNSAAEIDQIKKGQITLIALHAADAPFLVNNCGYQPAAVLADTAGGISGNRLDMIVPASSPLQHLSDLRGKTVVCAVPSSITGYRAAVTLLMQNEGLRPNVDYYITFSLKQKASIEGVVKKQFEVAAVSHDKLQSMIDDGKVDLKDYRVLYESEIIPRMTIGWFNNLKPELADKVRDAVLSYQPPKAETTSAKAQKNTSTEPADANVDAADSTDASPFHWKAVDYKTDFQLVRAIDDRFDPRLDSKAVK